MTDETQTLERLGPYRLLRVLGSGGMGTVYLAEDLDEERQVALKVLHPHLVEREGFFKRFQREAQAGESVDHPNVVRTLDSGFHLHEGKPHCVLAMEYVEGQTLRDLLRENGTVPEALVREIALQTADGLAAIHEAGIVHRDIKPENVLITKDHEIRIMDLGVARWTQASTVLTREGQFAGSLPYAAPEQFGQGTIGPAIDLYALGVVLYELATGHNPFRHEEPAKVVRAHLDETPLSLAESTPEASVFLSAVVSTLLAKEQSGRFDTAAHLAQVMRDGGASPWFVSCEATASRVKSRVPRVPVRRETQLHGRSSDLLRLREVWGQARNGSGRCVLLEGEAGIGKSRLVAEFLSQLEDGQAHVLYGSFAPSGGPGALSGSLCAFLGTTKLEERLREHLPELPRLVSAFASMLEHQAAPEGATGLDTQGVHAAFVQVMRSLAAERPLVWVVEDLHFASPDEHAIALSLARALTDQRILLLLTTRPGVPEATLAHFGSIECFSRSSLGRLSAREVILLLQDAFRNNALAEKLGGKIALKSDGVPFFVFEMIRGLQDGQFITELPDGSWVDTQEIEDIDVPSAVRDLIEARLSNLSREEREILDVGSVVGFEFEADLVARVLELPRVAVLRVLVHVERKSGVVGSAGRKFRFDHHQIQEVLYDSIPEELREAYHALAAKSFLARWREKADSAKEPGGEDAVFLATHMLLGSRPEEARSYVLRGVQHLGDTHRMAAAVQLSTQALECEGALEKTGRAEVLLRKLQSCVVVGVVSSMERDLEEALSLVESEPASRLRTSILLALAGHLLATGRLDEALGTVREAKRVAESCGDPHALATSALMHGNLLYYTGDLDHAIEEYRLGEDFAKRAGDSPTVASAVINRGSMLIAAGDRDGGCAVVEEGLELARRSDAPRWASVALQNLGDNARLAGDLERAQACTEEALAICRGLGNRSGLAGCCINLGQIAVQQKAYAEAESWCQQALAASHEAGAPEIESHALRLRAHVNASAGRHGLAREWAVRALDLAREVDLPISQCYAGGVLAQVLLALGEIESAREAAQEAVECARRAGQPALLAESTFCSALVTQCEGDPAEAERQWRAALSLDLEGHGRVAQAADAHRELGRICRTSGRAQEAQTHLQTALSLARQAKHASAEVGALCELVLLGEESAEDALRLAIPDVVELLQARELHLVWRVTGDREYLGRAYRGVQELLANTPQENRERILELVPEYVEVLTEWEREPAGDG